MTEPDPPVTAGASSSVLASRLVLADLTGTAALLVTTVAAWAVSAEIVDLALLVVSSALFIGGCAAFTVGFLRAVGRSRYEEIHLAGLFYLTGTAPKEMRDVLLRLWFAQIALATIGLVVTQPPFGVMAPVWGIGVLTLWGARHGRFPERAPAPRRGR